MRSKVLVSVLVVLALLFSFGMAEKASADSILFPWLVKSSSVITLVSVVNTSDINTICRFDSNPAMLHYQYWYKPDDLTSVCGEVDTFMRTSENDLVVFEASGLVSTLPLFNDTPGHNSLVNYGVNANPTMTSAPTPSRAFLIVDNNDEPKEECFENSDEASLYGEAMVIEVNNGAAWGYVAYNGRGGGPGGPNSEPILGFADKADMQGEVMRSPRYFDSADDGTELEATPVVLLPLNKFKTKFFMTPENYAMWEYGSGPGARIGDANARIQLCYDPTPVNSGYPFTTPCGALSVTDDSCQPSSAPVCSGGGIFDNDERPISGTLPLNVVCTGAQDIGVADKLLNSTQITYLESFGGAAWAYVRSMIGTAFPSDGNGVRDKRTESDMIIGKLDYTEGPFAISGQSVNGEINDFKWIRNSGSRVDWDFARGINQIVQDDGYGD